MAEEPKSDDIKDILADLDAILSGLTPAAKPAPPPGEKNASAAAEQKQKTPEPKPAVVKDAPSAPPEKAASSGEYHGQGSTSSPVVPGADIGAGYAPGTAGKEARPLSAPPASGEGKEPSVPAVPKEFFQMKPPVERPPRTAAPAQAAAPPKSGELEIELAPRAGMIKPPEAAPPPKPVTPPAQPAGDVKPSLEIDISTAEPAAPPPPPLKSAPTGGKAPPPAPKAPAAAGGQAPKAAYEIRPPLESHIPADVPKDQIRRVAFIYVGSQEARFYEFVQFLDSVALNVSKKPLFISKALIVKINPEAADFQALLEKVKGSQAVGVVGILTGMPWARTRDLQELFKSRDIFFRAIDGEDALKRSAVVDLVVELMLLGPG